MTAVGIARRIRVRGVVQGVGFRPHVYRLAHAYRLTGWVLNDGRGVEIHVEGTADALDAFIRALASDAPSASIIDDLAIAGAPFEAHDRFEIRGSPTEGRPTTRMSPDLPVCDACLRELFDPADRRAGYPYINCTDCGPRFSIVRALPYDRRRTTMAGWPMCAACDREYADPADRRFHAQPVACPACGPGYVLVEAAAADVCARGAGALAQAAGLLRSGAIVAVKGVGGYHLACDAGNAAALVELRERKYRKEQAFAVMVRDLQVARETCELSPVAESLLTSAVRPIVLAPKRVDLPGVAPDNTDIGLMLPYAPIHHLLFAGGAPARLVMTSGNRSSEPIAYRDEEAVVRLGGLADAMLVGERPIARRIDDSVARAGAAGPMILRRSRGLAPGAVAALPLSRPVLALGGDLKNTVTLVVDGQAYVSQHIGDLAHHDARVACREAVEDLVAMYDVSWPDVLVVHDAHPEYVSTGLARELAAGEWLAVQHHRAHVASVAAERGALDRRLLGIALDGTGFGDDGTIWGGELFVGSVLAGFERVAHLRPARLAGGDAAARLPPQAAAGFVEQVDHLPDLLRPPFAFPQQYRHARTLLDKRVRVFPTTSAGRLFDAVAALAGFTRPITFEGQAALWLEHAARRSTTSKAYRVMFDGTELDWRPALAEVVHDRIAGVDRAEIARAFHLGLARGLASAAMAVLDRAGLETVVLSGGVAQNEVLLAGIRSALPETIDLWVNHRVPPNDGGLSLGQAALAAGQTPPRPDARVERTTESAG